MSGRFVDLNLPWEVDDVRKQKIVERLIADGYEGVAYNLKIAGNITDQHTKQIKFAPKLDAKSVPLSLKRSIPSFRLRQKEGMPAFEQWKRVTVVLSQGNQVYQLSSNAKLLHEFDLVAVQPLTEKLFEQACRTLDVDLITFDLTEKLPFSLRFPTVKQAIDRGVFFEITYSPAIGDTEGRRRFLTNAMNLVRVTRGRNIVVTGGATSELKVRSPFDVMALMALFNIDISSARKCLTVNTRSLLYKGLNRLSYRSIAMVAEDVPPLSFSSTDAPTQPLSSEEKLTEETVDSDPQIAMSEPTPKPTEQVTVATGTGEQTQMKMMASLMPVTTISGSGSAELKKKKKKKKREQNSPGNPKKKLKVSKQ